MFTVFIWKSSLLYSDIHHSELICSCYYVHVFWVRRSSQMSSGALTQSHFRTIKMEGKEATAWVIHPVRCHMLVSAWTIMQSPHVTCNLHMLTLTSPLGCQIDISNKTCLKPNSWFSAPMPNLQPYLSYFSKWKLNSSSCLGKKAEVSLLLFFQWFLGLIFWDGPHDFCTLICIPWCVLLPLCVNGTSDMLLCYIIWQNAWDIISVILLCYMAKIKR